MERLDAAADRLHPERRHAAAVPWRDAPKRVTRTSHTSWTLSDFLFSALPFHNFHEGVGLAASATTGSVTVNATHPVFTPAHVGNRIRIETKRLIITGFTSPFAVTATVEDTLTTTAITGYWDETAFSAVRGWPICACFHQARLVLGGSRDLPNRLWLSRTGDLGDFDPGSGLDDEAIEFALMSDQVNAIARCSPAGISRSSPPARNGWSAVIR